MTSNDVALGSMRRQYDVTSTSSASSTAEIIYFHVSRDRPSDGLALSKRGSGPNFWWETHPAQKKK